MRLVFAVLVGLAMAGCAQPITDSPPETAESDAAATPTPTRSPRPTPRPTSSGFGSHEAPELEALLPETVNSETLERNSIVGHTFIERIVGDILAVDADAYERGYLDAGLDLEQLRMAQATPNGGLDVVRVTLWPNDEVGIYNYELMVWAAGIRDDLFFADPYPLQDVVMSGKQVGVGTPEMMVNQSESFPQRRPYVYTTGDYVFLIVAAGDEWAEQVLQQLP